MRIMIVTDWFSPGMGYIENTLPKAMAELGHDIHVVAGNIQVYFNSPFYKETYEKHLGPGVVPCGTQTLDGYTLHRLPHATVGRLLWIRGLREKIRELRPEVVQAFDIASLTSYELALLSRFLPFRLYTGNHIVASVFPPMSKPRHGLGRVAQLSRLAPAAVAGKLLSTCTTRCYAATSDAAEIAVRYLWTPAEKVEVLPLCVDTDLFQPVEAEPSFAANRSRVRSQHGIRDDEVLCVYTGRFVRAKNPLCLARAVEILKTRGEPFLALFVGSGDQADSISGCQGCIVHPFVEFKALPPFYHAADIGIWPRQESTSMLDASACGLPIVVSDRVLAKERIEGNGRTYREDDPEDLARVLVGLRDAQVRTDLGKLGVNKIASRFSWRAQAKKRIADYESDRR